MHALLAIVIKSQNLAEGNNCLSLKFTANFTQSVSLIALGTSLILIVEYLALTIDEGANSSLDIIPLTAFDTFVTRKGGAVGILSLLIVDLRNYAASRRKGVAWVATQAGSISIVGCSAELIYLFANSS